MITRKFSCRFVVLEDEFKRIQSVSFIELLIYCTISFSMLLETLCTPKLQLSCFWLQIQTYLVCRVTMNEEEATLTRNMHS